jgi:hypothetical protein
LKLSVSEYQNTVLHRLPRRDSDDALGAAREAVNGNFWRYLASTEDLVKWLQVGPVVVTLNWFEDFNQPKKHPFLKARREFFFIGEALDLGEMLGSWTLIANGYHKARTKQQWIRFQNCWGHDYPLVWMPLETVSGLWHSGQLEASIAG